MYNKQVRAVDGMYQERTQIFATFGVGLFCTLFAAILASVIVMHPEAAAVCVSILLYVVYRIYSQAKRIFGKFRFEEDEGTNFDDILTGNIFTAAVS
jgi:hypothetical protein